VQTDQLMTITEAAQKLGITRQTIHNAIARNELDVVEMFGRRLLKRQQVEAYVPKPPHRPRKEVQTKR
jgi:excisionase family DNA binding protein